MLNLLVSQFEDQEEEEDPTSSDEGEDLFFDSIENVETFKGEEQEARTVEAKQLLKTEKDGSKSVSSSLSDVSARMGESFVRLYSSSAEELPSSPPDLRITSSESIILVDDDYEAAAEIKDPEAFEGRKKQHPTLKLLHSDEPLWEPFTQVPYNVISAVFFCLKLCS